MRGVSTRSCAPVSASRGGMAAIPDSGTGERDFDRLRIVGDELQPDVAVRGRPARGDAADEQRRPGGEPLHPRERLLALQRAASPRALRRRRARDESASASSISSSDGKVAEPPSISCRAALRLASDQSVRPCSAMRRAAVWAIRRRSSRARASPRDRARDREGRRGCDGASEDLVADVLRRHSGGATASGSSSRPRGGNSE